MSKLAIRKGFFLWRWMAADSYFHVWESNQDQVLWCELMTGSWLDMLTRDIISQLATKTTRFFSCKSWNELCTTGLWFPARSQVTMDSFPTIPAMGQGFAATVGKLFLIKAGLCSGTYWYRWVKYSWALNLLLSWRYMAQYLLFRILKWPVTQLSML